MSGSHVYARAQVPCEAFIGALTDFSAGRQEVFANSAGSYLKVHELGPSWADVTEGSAVGGGIWQRLRYDWSTPGRVRLEVVEGNVFGQGGWWEYRLSPRPGGCGIDLTVHRVPVTGRGRLLDVVLRGFGRWFHGRDLRRTLRKLEAAARPSSS